MKFYDELKYRGLIESVTSPEVEEKLNNGGLNFYIGTDPTADSLHIGHFMSVILMPERLKRAGHNPTILIGGGTGLIGDPKLTGERDIIKKETVSKNIVGLKKQIEGKFGFNTVNNNDWYEKINFIDFLRDYGKCFNLNYMLDKETVKSRLETGISYTEFSYMILQSIDFLHLYQDHGVTMQIGGSDQWGNITSGLELIRKKTGATDCYGFTMPLVTKSDGTKFGKSEGGLTLWLDKEKTSSYQWYQYLLNSEDNKVIDYLKKLTFLSPEEINELEKKHNENPHLREAHKALAKEIITFIHSEEDYLKAVKISECLFKGNIKELTEDELKVASDSLEKKEVELNQILLEVLVSSNVCSSRREAREFLNNNAITLNGEKVNDENMIIDKSSLLFNKYLIIRKGKKNYYSCIIKGC